MYIMFFPFVSFAYSSCYSSSSSSLYLSLPSSSSSFSSASEDVEAILRGGARDSLIAPRATATALYASIVYIYIYKERTI